MLLASFVGNGSPVPATQGAKTLDQKEQTPVSAAMRQANAGLFFVQQPW